MVFCVSICDAARCLGDSQLHNALENPQKIINGIDPKGRPFEQFIGKDAQVVVNPQTGEVVSMNPLSGNGVRGQ